MKLYRVMKIDSDGKPMVGTRGSMLGVRPTDPLTTLPNPVFDVAAITDSDLVHPGEGLSTSPNPRARRPRKAEAIFEIETDDLNPDLLPHHDHPNHCLLEPARPMTLREFQLALSYTRDLWIRL